MDDAHSQSLLHKLKRNKKMKEVLHGKYFDL